MLGNLGKGIGEIALYTIPQCCWECTGHITQTVRLSIITVTPQIDHGHNTHGHGFIYIGKCGISTVHSRQQKIIGSCPFLFCPLSGTGHNRFRNRNPDHIRPSGLVIYKTEFRLHIGTGHFQQGAEFSGCNPIVNLLRRTGTVFYFQIISRVGAENQIIAFNQLEQQVFTVAAIYTKMAHVYSDGTFRFILHKITV